MGVPTVYERRERGVCVCVGGGGGGGGVIDSRYTERAREID